MKKMFDCADAFIQARDWKMLTLLKFCLFSIGIIVGLFLPKKYKKPALASAFVVFLVTYVPLMADFGKFAIDYFNKDK